MTKEELIKALKIEIKCYNCEDCPTEECKDCPYCSTYTMSDLMEWSLKYLKEN